MHIIGRNKIEQFKKKHPTSRKALDRLVKLLQNVILKSPQDIKNLFGVNVDFVGNQVIFDVGGNKVRMISKIGYSTKVILITHVLTHKEYDKANWREF